MRLVFLGTSAGAPTRARNVTSQALVHDDGAIWLLDCGEATQHQVTRYGLRAKAIAGILVTHLHGDHCYGLPGMLMAMAIAGRETAVTVVAPQGLRAWVEQTLTMSAAELPFAVDFHELAADRQVLTVLPGWTIRAIRIRHRIACWGYALHEAPRPRRLYPERADAVGVPPHERKLLVRGTTVTTAAGRVVMPDDCCDPPRPGRIIGLLGDTDDADTMIADLQHADVVVREATYESSRNEQARQWGHSTTTMTGAFAAACHAQRLIVTHLSARYTVPNGGRHPAIAQLVSEVAAACPGVEVIAADDGLSIDIP